MRYFDEAKCRICKRIFCCGKCRQKHQFDTHAIAVHQAAAGHPEMNDQRHGDGQVQGHIVMKSTTVYVFCPICEQKPLALRQEMYAELLAHIESVHLPLRCRKCQRQYTKIDDLRQFSKCVDLGQNCSTASTEQNHSCNTDASKITVKKATVAAITISTQTSPSIVKDMQQHSSLISPISLYNLRWKAKGRLAHEEFISDSVSSIRNLSVDSCNLSAQPRRSIGQLAAPPDCQQTATKGNGKLIRSTSTPLQVGTICAKPKETLTFNASAGGGVHMSSIYHSGYVLDEHNSPATGSDNSNLALPQAQQPQQQQQRAWKVPNRAKMSAVTPLRQVMSKSIQKAFVEHGVGMLASQGEQRRLRLDLSENSLSDTGLALDLRLSPAVRRTQSEVSMAPNQRSSSRTPESYQILLSAQKLTTESIIITRSSKSSSSSFLPTSTANASTTSTVYNSCESVEIITSSTAELSANTQAAHGVLLMPPITPITRIPGAIINKKLIKFETPQKTELQISQANESTQDDREAFYTPNPGNSPTTECVDNSPAASSMSNSRERRRQQIVPRQLTGDFSPEKKREVVQRPHGPRARPPLRICHNQKTFTHVQDIESDDEDAYEDEVFRPSSASTHNDKKSKAEVTQPEQGKGRLWSLMSSVLGLPAALRSDRHATSEDKENAGPSSLMRRCASFAGSFVRAAHLDDDANMQSLKRKRTQTLDSQYYTGQAISSSSKRIRIQPRKPIERMRNT